MHNEIGNPDDENSEINQEVEDEATKESVFKSSLYYDLEEAAKEVHSKEDDLDKLVSTAKFAGKIAANIGVFGLKLGGKVVENLPQIASHMADNLLKNGQNISEEQREKLTNVSQKKSWGDYKAENTEENE